MLRYKSLQPRSSLSNEHPFFSTPKLLNKYAYNTQAFFVNNTKTASLVRDGFFKALFNDPNDPQKIISLLNAVKGYQNDEKIKAITFRDPYFEAFVPKEKNIIADVVCESHGRTPEIHIIEMQQVLQEGFLKRWHFSASRAFTTELNAIGKYKDLKKVHVTAIMKHEIPFSNDTYRFVGKTSNAEIENIFELSLFSLAKIGSEISVNDTCLDKWLHLLKYSGTSLLNVDALVTEPVLAKAVLDAKRLIQTPPPLIVEENSKGTSMNLLNRKIRELPK